VRTRKRFIASTNTPSIAPTFLISSGVRSTPQGLWQFLDLAVLGFGSSSKCADNRRRAKKLTGNNLARFLNVPRFQ
jgi:hypothetical protein